MTRWASCMLGLTLNWLCVSLDNQISCFSIIWLYATVPKTHIHMDMSQVFWVHLYIYWYLLEWWRCRTYIKVTTISFEEPIMFQTNIQSSQFHLSTHVSTGGHSTERNKRGKIGLFLTFGWKINQNMVHFSLRHIFFAGACNRSLRTTVFGVKMYLNNLHVKASPAAHHSVKKQTKITSHRDLKSKDATIRYSSKVSRLFWMKQQQQHQFNVQSHKPLYTTVTHTSRYYGTL